MRSWRLRAEAWTGAESLISRFIICFFLHPLLLLFLPLLFCVWGEACMHTHIHGYSCVITHAWSCRGQRLTLHAFFYGSLCVYNFFSYRVSHWVWNLTVWLDCSASEFQGSACLSLLYAILKTQASIFVPRFFCLMCTMGIWTQVFKFIQ